MNILQLADQERSFRLWRMFPPPARSKRKRTGLNVAQMLVSECHIGHWEMLMFLHTDCVEVSNIDDREDDDDDWWT